MFFAMEWKGESKGPITACPIHNVKCSIHSVYLTPAWGCTHSLLHTVYDFLWGCSWSSEGLSHQKFTSLSASHKTVWISGIRSSINTHKSGYRFHLKFTIFLDLNFYFDLRVSYLKTEELNFPLAFDFLLNWLRREKKKKSIHPKYYQIRAWLSFLKLTEISQI